MTINAADVIRETKAVLFERGWYQGSAIGPDRSVCLVGATCVAEIRLGIRDTTSRASAAGDYARATLNTCSRERGAIGSVTYNDEEGRTFDEIVDLCDVAEKRAEEAAA